jgi:hypothetical protein
MSDSSKGFSPLLRRGFEVPRVGEPALVRKVPNSSIWLVFYLHFEGRKPWALDVRYAFLHEEAEAFAVECVKHASNIGHRFPTVKKWHSFLQFTVGEFFGWRPNWKRFSADSETKELFTERVLNEIAVGLLPKLESVESERALMQALLDRDQNGHRTWWRTNGAIRAAVILYLSDRLGLDCSDLKQKLMHQEKLINLGIEGRGKVEGLAARFLAQVTDALKMRAARAAKLAAH